jgi:ferric-dicitrate binding protein FerR (iron transport regulator)
VSWQQPSEGNLRRLLRDARTERAADLDWARVEDRLMREVERTVPSPARSPYPFAWGALAVAAVAAVWLVNERAGESLPQARPAIIEATEPLRRNGNALALGTRVEAAEREVAVDHASRVTWTLAPNSGARLAEKGERITIKLERGSVLSEVVPNPKPETFVVEAAGTRVAVHGTVFRVELEGGRVIVQVREGTVAVGPLGAVPTFFLKAPAHGDFAADGRSGSIDGRPLGQSAERRAEPLRLSPVRSPSVVASSSASASVSSAELPSEPSINDIESGIASIVAVTSDCFNRNTKSAEGVQITVRTALSLSVDGAGTVSDVEFQPPLSPEVEECAAARIAGTSFTASKQGVKVTRMLELKR